MRDRVSAHPMFHHLLNFVRGLRPNDAITAWKAIAIVLTGGFGILGLTKDFKDKQTNKITKWGLISLLGIVVSSIGGVIVQLKESSANASVAVASSQRADQTLEEVEKSLSPITTDALIKVVFMIDCTKETYKLLCREVKRIDDGQDMLLGDKVWNNVPPAVRNGFTMRFYFFKYSDDAKSFIWGKKKSGDLEMYVQMGRSIDDAAAAGPIIDRTLVVFEGVVSYAVNHGLLKSISDLEDAKVVITGDHIDLSPLELYMFDVWFKATGREISEHQHYEKIALQGQPAYSSPLN
jgi:hypothetical protein